MWWVMATATRRPLPAVVWRRATPASLQSWVSGCHGAPSTAETRGSPPAAGTSSFATSSDWTTTRSGASSGSTS